MRALMLPALLPLMAACTAPSAPVERVPLAPEVTLSLPADGELERTVDVVQLVTARKGADAYLIEGRLSAGPRGLVLVGTDSMGRRAMTIDWRGGKLTVEKAPWLPAELLPQNVLGDIVLLFWPEDVVRRHLVGAALEADAQGRHLRRNGTDVVVIRYQGDPWTGTAQLTNFAWGYEIEVRSAGAGP